MTLNWIDWSIVAAFLTVSLAVGLAVTKRAGSSASEFFLAGRGMPWWLLGASMVATTFSAGTPNLVTDLVRQNGVAGNWIWWSFLLTGMTTVFIYARLWRRTGAMTDVEFYELRYSGRPAAFLRGFRALYLGVLFNIVVMASATLAVIKIAGAMLGTSPVQTVVVAGGVTALYSMLGGLTGVLLTDFLMFAVAMGGAIAAAVYLVQLPSVGGLAGLMSHEAVQTKLSLFPDWHDPELLLSVFIIPLTVQWWSVWYPGAEPGGGGYIAQRMLAAKNETHATGAALLFNVAHYAFRPWPWILVALASLVVFPDIASLQAAFPRIDPGVVKHDLAYPAMLTLLPHGLQGLVLASLMAAFMSTLSTHLNWGSSYIVNDFYTRFLRPAASDREQVFVGRLSTLLMMIVAGTLGLWLSNALQAFHLILQIGAGTGLLFLLRWFWWRINAFSEIAAMIVSFAVAVYFEFLGPAGLAAWQKIVLGVAITTAAWLAVTWLTRPTDQAILRRFYRLVHPGGPGWADVVRRAAADGEPLEAAAQPWNVPLGILCAATGCVAVYAAVLGTGCWIYSQYVAAAILTAVAGAASLGLMTMWKRANARSAGIGNPDAVAVDCGKGTMK
jgi:Na+/proline symporter